MHRCKFCPHHFSSYRVLRHHVENTHPAEFSKVTQWLGKTQDKLAELERIARDGMLGPGKSAGVPNSYADTLDILRKTPKG